MTSTEDSGAVAALFFKSFETSDSDTALGLLDDRVTWWLPRSVGERIMSGLGGKWPEGGRLEGKDALVNGLVEPLTGRFHDGSMKFEIQEVISEGELASVSFHLDADVKAGGSYHNDYCMVLTVRDGRIVAVREYIGDPMHTFEALSL